MFNNENVRGLRNKLKLLSENDNFLKDYITELENRINRIARIQRYGEKDGATISCGVNKTSLALYFNDNEYIFRNFFEDNTIVDKNYSILECADGIFVIKLYLGRGLTQRYVLNIKTMKFVQTDYDAFYCETSKDIRKTMKE